MPPKAVFCFLSEPNIPEGPDYEIIHFIDAWGGFTNSDSYMCERYLS